MEISAGATEVAAAVAVIILTFVLFYFFSGTKPTPSSESKKKFETKPKPQGPFALAEVAIHNKPDDAWIIVDGKVYDVTEFVDEHPGGDTILRNVGGDSSIGFHGPQHADTVWDVLSKYYIGDLKTET